MSAVMSVEFLASGSEAEKSQIYSLYGVPICA